MMINTMHGSQETQETARTTGQLSARVGHKLLSTSCQVVKVVIDDSAEEKALLKNLRV